MHGRGCSKRHTVGCTDDLSASGGQISSGTNGEVGAGGQAIPGGSGVAASGASSGGGRTRRSGLLTVTERPPGE